jgi:hypothetical protein
MILVFDMVLSLWALIDGANSKQRVFDLIPAEGLEARNFQEIDGSPCGHTSRKVQRIVTDR